MQSAMSAEDYGNDLVGCAEIELHRRMDNNKISKRT